MRVILILASLLVSGHAFGQMQDFTVVDPMTGQVQMGNVQTFQGGSQSYSWTDSSGHTTTGYVSPPTGPFQNFTTTDATTGQVQYGTIVQPMPMPMQPPAQPFLPMPPSMQGRPQVR